MKVLVIGKGGREHALIWKLAQSPQVTKLYVAPGNPGCWELAEAVDIPNDQYAALVKFAQENEIDLTVVGPEAPLAAGIVDKFRKKGLRIFGPTQRCARLEGSKSFAKNLMAKHGIPTGYAKTFHDFNLAVQYLERAPLPTVVKADGLAAGKGVAVCSTLEEAVQFARDIMRDAKLGEAGRSVVIEDFLEGDEVSLMAISDGQTIIPLEPAQDHKALKDGGRGPNTGGMGCYSPLPRLSDDQIEEMEREIIVQGIHAVNSEGEPFGGCLFAGIMLTDDGPKVLEYNVRFGDPEAQAMVRRLKSDLFPLLYHACDGTLDQCDVEWDERSVVTVVLAAGGYPGKLDTSVPIHGLNQDFGDDVVVFHAGTQRIAGQIQTGGGRVVAVTAMGDTLEEAQAKAYAAADKIEFKGKQVRRDIGQRGISWLTSRAAKD